MRVVAAPAGRPARRSRRARSRPRPGSCGRAPSRPARPAPRARAARGSRARCRSGRTTHTGPGRRSLAASRQYRASNVLCGMKNAEIAAALDELGDLYELDGAVVYRVVAYREAANSIRDSPVSVAQLAPRGPRDRAAQRRQDARGEDPRAARDGRHPGGRRSCARSSRASWCASRSIPGLGPKTARKIHDELGISTLEELREAAESGAPARRPGPRAEGRAEHRSRRSRSSSEEGPAERLLLSAVLDDRRADRRAPARAPGRRPRRDRRQRAPHDRHLQGPRHHRDRARPGRAHAGVHARWSC